jgi:thiol-disulfide isomerase/thioredoxin
MTSDSAQAPHHARRRLALVVAGGIAGVAIGLGAVYGIAALTRNAGDNACRPAVETAKRLAPLAKGEVAAVKPAEQPLRVPALAFQDAGGSPKSLADWRGRVTLVNLWATWCVPCRKEMPALDELQAKLGSDRFEVVAVNIDTHNPDKPKAWLRDTGIARLTYFADPSAQVFRELKSIGRAVGMPTTLLVDAKGCELASIAGPAEWASEDAVRLVEAALRP